MYKNVQNSILGDGQATIVHMVIAWDIMYIFQKKNFLNLRIFSKNFPQLARFFWKIDF